MLLKNHLFVGLAWLALGAVPVQAASLSFVLDQSNELPDGLDYLSVTLEDVSGGVTFQVLPQSGFQPIADFSDLRIKGFGFSLATDAGASIVTPDAYRLFFDRNVSEFGRFDYFLQGNGKKYPGSLNFSVANITTADIEQIFVAHVSGFDFVDAGAAAFVTESDSDDSDSGDSDDISDSGLTTSAFFAGGVPQVPPTTVVPLPAALWLFGAGLVGMIAVARRRAG